MTAREFLSETAALTRALGDLSGLRVADVGCGEGRLSRALAALGAEVAGIEPNPAAVAKAQAEGGGPRYIAAGAEATGLDAESQDVTLFSFSLHHVPDMPAGLREAHHITRPGGRVAVMEPEAPDPFYPVLSLIDDEAPVYAEAIETMAKAETSGLLRKTATLAFAEKYRAKTPEALLAKLVTVDNGRSLPETDRPAFETAFANAVKQDDEGGYFECWARVDVFERL